MSDLWLPPGAAVTAGSSWRRLGKPYCTGKEILGGHHSGGPAARRFGPRCRSATRCPWSVGCCETSTSAIP